MATDSGRQIRLLRRPVHDIQPDDFDVVRKPLRSLEPGEVLLRNTWLSVDASTMRRITGHGGAYLTPYEPGATLDGWAVGHVEESRCARLPVGARVLHNLGWRDYALLNGEATGWGTAERLPDDDSPDSDYLGPLGPTGLTAWAGLHRVAEIREGDVVFVSAAAGAVGLLVVQLAKRRGHRVVASAGSDEKGAFLEKLGADSVFNYRTAPIAAQLASSEPAGIDVYFDNVGGDHLEAALDSLRPGGRVALCGAVSGYAPGASTSGPQNLFNATAKGLTLRGFLARMYADDFEAARADVRVALQEGLEFPLHVRHGLDEVPAALLDIFAGRNTGKVLVEIS